MRSWLNSLSIKTKLIVIFIFFKVLPLVLVAVIALLGVKELSHFFKSDANTIKTTSENIVKETAQIAIKNSIDALDKKSQSSLELLTTTLAQEVANFLYERDNDLLFLASHKPNQNLFKSFMQHKTRAILEEDDALYSYNEATQKWEYTASTQHASIYRDADLEDNAREFQKITPKHFKRKHIPLYKEVSFFDVAGQERFKVSTLDTRLKDVSKQSNTYIKAERYFPKLSTLKKGDIYVSEVIGKQVKSRVIGTFTKEKALKAGIAFEPEKHGYAGKENPKGKRFEGIVRFITPVFERGKKVGYLSLALDHRHLMEFTDTVDPVAIGGRTNIADASTGNYAFMWSQKGYNISHTRDYFIYGFDENTGKRALPWLSRDTVEAFKNSKQESLQHFLQTYPKFHEQSLEKKPNLAQLKKGLIPLDCQYLNFAPQCQGWMQVTQEGGFGSFVIFWSGVWKLTTAATIPYYTGEYGRSKRGFGFITIGANVEEFHSAANKTQDDIDSILSSQITHIDDAVRQSQARVQSYTQNILNELSLTTAVLVIIVIFIALWISNYVKSRLNTLILGTKKFSENELSYRIDIDSHDEIGELSKAFNTMASSLEELLEAQKHQNEKLEQKVSEEVSKSRQKDQVMVSQARNAAMGEMLAMIAHQWRQPLNALGIVIQNLDFSQQMGLLDEKTIQESVQKSIVLTESMSKTIDDFRDFFKPDKERVNFSINENINNTLEMVRISFENHNINFETHFEQEHLVFGQANELAHVFINLFNNSKDAFKEKKTENACINVVLKEENKKVKVFISDNAGGIDVTILEYIFDPYFSTKLEKNGTGLGLYMSKMIIEKNMSGKIHAYNNDAGVTFEIELPKVENG